MRSSSAWAGRWPGTKRNVKRLEDTVKNYLRAGDRETAAQVGARAPARRQRAATKTTPSSRLHEQAYENNLLKIKHAGGKLAEIRNKIAKYDADLKMSARRPRWPSWPRTFTSTSPPTSARSKV